MQARLSVPRRRQVLAQLLSKVVALTSCKTATNVELLGELWLVTSCAWIAGDPSIVLEELCWLLRVAGHSLADSGQGETPMVPLRLIEAGRAAEAAGKPDPVLALSNALLGVLHLALNPAARQHISPRCACISEITLLCSPCGQESHLL